MSTSGGSDNIIAFPFQVNSRARRAHREVVLEGDGKQLQQGAKRQRGDAPPDGEPMKADEPFQKQDTTEIRTTGVVSTLPAPSLQWVKFPDVPYYSILKSLTISINVAESDSSSCCHSTNIPMTKDYVAKRGSVIIPNPPHVASRLAHLHRILQQTVRRYGTFFYMGTHILADDTTSSSPLQHLSGASQGTLDLRYGAYINGLHDAYRRLCGVRDAFMESHDAATAMSTMCSPHTTYLRIAAHPVWKELCVLLTIEKHRLLVCLISSSRVVQKQLSELCSTYSVPLEWLGGAALVVEPAALSRASVNPVSAIWDVLLHLPLLTTPLYNVAVLHTADTVLSGFHISIFSSLPIDGATPYHPQLQLTDEAALYHPSEDASGLPARRRTPSGRRWTWRLLPFPTVVLPRFFMQLIRCLVEDCGLLSFQLTCETDLGGRDASSTVPLTDTATRSSPQLSLTPISRPLTGGIRLMRGVAPLNTSPVAAFRRGPSSTLWIGMSRLSGAAQWIHGTEAAAVAKDMEEKEDEEVEFSLFGMAFCREPTVESWRSVLLPELEIDRRYPPEIVTSNSSEEDDRLRPSHWGNSFSFSTATKKIIILDGL